eukprot:9486944-Pyramimonas_sp.AAC.1
MGGGGGGGDLLGASWGTLGVSWELPGSLLEASWGSPSASCGPWGLVRGLFGNRRAFLGYLTPSGAVLGASLD